MALKGGAVSISAPTANVPAELQLCVDCPSSATSLCSPAEVLHAGERDSGQSEGGRPRGKVAEHPGGRVRSRRNTPHSRRQTRRGIYQASDRNWFIEGTPCRCEVAGPVRRQSISPHPRSGRAGL